MTRRGFGDAADRIQELYLAGRKEEATDAVPDEWVDEKSLVGSPDRIRERFKRWAALEMVDSVYIRTTQDAAVELMAGKILGIAATGLTIILAWAAIFLVLAVRLIKRT